MSLGRWRDKVCRERSGRNERNIALTQYIETYIARWIGRCQEVTGLKNSQMSYRASIRKLSRGVHNKVISTDRETIEHLSSIQKLPRWIENLSSIYQVYRNFFDGSKICWEAIEPNSQKPRWIEIAITTIKKRSSRGSIDSLAVEIAQKQFFKEEKNTDMNSIKHVTQPKIQTSF